VSTDLAELVSVLENEISVGEELSRNIEVQKQAILDWDMVKLLEQIDGREPWLRSLSQLEEQRCEIVKHIGLRSGSLTLRQIIAALPQEGSERVRFGQLREQTEKVFTRLRAEERSLHELMETLLAHIQEALTSLAPPLVPVYSENGVTLPSRTKSGLLCSKV
jgi:hypothetical protein